MIMRPMFGSFGRAVGARRCKGYLGSSINSLMVSGSLLGGLQLSLLDGLKWSLLDGFKGSGCSPCGSRVLLCRGHSSGPYQML